MAKIADGVLKTWHDGDTVTAADYHQEREMLRIAVNDTDTRVDSTNINVQLISEEQDNLSTALSNLKGATYNGTTTVAELNVRMGNAESQKADKTDVYTKSQTYSKTEVDLANMAQDTSNNTTYARKAVTSANVTSMNGWIKHTSYKQLTATLDDFGFVTIEGTVTGGTYSSSGTLGLIASTGSRPVTERIFMANGWNATNGFFVHPVKIKPDGTIQFFATAGTVAYSCTEIHINYRFQVNG